MVAVLAAAYFLSDILSRYALLISIFFGVGASLLFLGILLLKRSARMKSADLLARASLYEDYDPAEFEAVTAEIYRQMGYSAKVTGKAGDLGIDVLLSKNGEKIGIQCKHYKGSIGPALIREFVGALEGARLKKGCFVTTSNYTEGAKKAAKRTNWDIELIDGKKLSRMLNNVDVDFDKELFPTQRWRNLPLLAKVGVMVFLLGDIAAVTGGMVYFLLSG